MKEPDYKRFYDYVTAFYNKNIEIIYWDFSDKNESFDEFLDEAINFMNKTTKFN